MKMILTILALLIFSISLNATPPDSCLWAPTPEHLSKYSAIIQGFYGKKDNSDSSLYIDTCGLYSLDYTLYLDSLGNHLQYPKLSVGIDHFLTTQKRYYSKHAWQLVFDLTSIPFDTTHKDLDNLYYFTVDDFDNNNSEISSGFQNLKNKYGNLMFRFLVDKNLSIKESMTTLKYNYKICYIESENLINMIEFTEFINSISNVNCYCGAIDFPITEVAEKSIKLLHPNPVKDILDLKFLQSSNFEMISIYNLNGLKVFESNYDEQINVSELQPGIYFLRYGDKTYKFIKE